MWSLMTRGLDCLLSQTGVSIDLRDPYSNDILSALNLDIKGSKSKVDNEVYDI